jgi:hypothetical protein
MIQKALQPSAPYRGALGYPPLGVSARRNDLGHQQRWCSSPSRSCLASDNVVDLHVSEPPPRTRNGSPGGEVDLVEAEQRCRHGSVSLRKRHDGRHKHESRRATNMSFLRLRVTSWLSRDNLSAYTGGAARRADDGQGAARYLDPVGEAAQATGIGQ